MMNKTIYLTLRSNQNANRLITGMLSTDLLTQVCKRTGLDKDQVLAGINRLQSLGLLDKEEVTLH